MSGTKNCAGMENKLVEYLDGRAKPAERRAVEKHLAACAECRMRAEQFRVLWDALENLPVLSPSASIRCVAARTHCRRTRAPRLLGLAAFAEAGIRRYRAGGHFGLAFFHAARCDRSAQAPVQVTAEADFTHDPRFAGA